MANDPPPSYEQRFDVLRRIGPFQVRGLLGRGASGAVYEAIDGQGREIALKMFDPRETMQRGEITRQRFLREAKILASIDHPAIVRLYASGEIDGQLYLAMARVVGTSLRDRRKAGSLPVAELVRLGVQLADALGHLHALGVIHRDLKPSNILLNASGDPVIADFGISTAPEVTALTQEGDVLGSPGFIAPECVEGGDSSPRSDIYALGRVLFECGAIHPPTMLPRGAPVMQRIIAATHIEWSRWPDDRPGQLLRPVLAKMLATAPGERYATAEAARVSLAALPLGLDFAPPTERGGGDYSHANTALIDEPELPLAPTLPDGDISQDPVAQARLRRMSSELTPPMPRPPTPAIVAPMAPRSERAASDQYVVPVSEATPVPPRAALGLGPSAPAPSPPGAGPGALPTLIPATAHSIRLERELEALRSKVAALEGGRRLRLVLLGAAIPMLIASGLVAGATLFPRGAEPARIPALLEPKYRYLLGGSGAAEDQGLALDLLSSARAAFAAGDDAQAERDAGRCVELADRPECHHLLGAILAAAGDPRAGWHSAQGRAAAQPKAPAPAPTPQAIAADCGRDPECYYRLGKQRAEDGQMRESAAAYRRFLELAPGDPRAEAVSRGLAAASQGSYDPK